MTGNHPEPPPAPSRRDRELFRRIVVEGEDRQSLAEEFNLKPTTIARALENVARHVAATHAPADPEVLIALHLDRLEHQWYELMQAWVRSTKVEETTKISTDGDGRRKAEQTRKAQIGDLRYLEQARRVLAEMRGLIGAHPQAANSSSENPDDDVDTLTFEQRAAALDHLLETLRQRARTQDDVGTDRGPPSNNNTAHAA